MKQITKEKILINGEYLTAQEAAKKVVDNELTVEDVFNGWVESYADSLRVNPNQE